MSTVLFDPIKTQSKVTDSVIVGFSCGKESVVVLDLCFKHFKNVYPYFMYVCPDLGFQEKALRWYEKKYQTEILRIPHFMLSDFFHYGSFRPGDPSFPIISMNDIYNYVRQYFGCYWIAAGERINDSIVRRAMIKQSSSIDVNRGRLYPVSEWSKQEIMNYIKFHHLYLGDDYNTVSNLRSSFGSLTSLDLKFLKDRHPEDYKKVLHLYPLAGAGVKRLEEYGKE